jgi:UDP-N-acetylglucosamine 2-epimerase
VTRFSPPPRTLPRTCELRGYREDQIHLVGNVMVDTLLANLERARARPVLGDLGLTAGEYGVVTLHPPRTSTTRRYLTCCSARWR